MDMTLRTLSPVHIGSGNTIEPFDYVTRFQDNKGTFVRINLDAFSERVLDLKPEAIGDFTEWISQTAERLDRTSNKDKFLVRREFKLDRFARDHLNASDLADGLIDDQMLSYYHLPINTDSELECKEQIKTADNRLYIPGSSLKGTLRTALAFQVLCEADEAFKRDLADGVRGTDRRGLRYHIRKRDQRSLGEEIDKAIFRCGVERRNVSFSDVHFDLMRGLQVSDTFDSHAQLAVLKANTFLRQKDGRNPSRTPRLNAQVPLLVEALLPGSLFFVRLNVNLSFVRHARPGVKGEWLELDERFERLFGFSRTELQKMDDTTASSRVLERILNACKKFSVAIAKEEVRWAQQFDRNDTGRILDFYSKLNTLSDETASQLHTPCVPVRLGWGSHFMSTTMLLALRNDPILGDVMTDIVRAFELDLIGNMKGKAGNPRTRTVRLDTFPRSRRMVALGDKAGLPFGWVTLSDPDMNPGDPFVDVDVLTRLYRSSQSQSSGPSRQGSQRSGYGGHQQSTSFEPRETARDQRVKRDASRGLQSLQSQKPQTSVRIGQQVNAEVISNDRRTVVVRLIDHQNEELRIQHPYYLRKKGETVKVKVQNVDDNTGRVTRVTL